MVKIEWKTCFRIGISAFLLYLCVHYWQNVSVVFGAVVAAATPLLVGAALAFVVNVLMSFYERHYFPKSKKEICSKTRRPLCLLLAYFTLIAVLVLVFWLVIPQLISCVQLIIRSLPDVIHSVIDTMQTWEFIPEDILEQLSAVDWTSRVNQLIDLFGSGLGSVVNVLINTVASVFSGVVTAFISIIFSVYLLSGKERLAGQFRRLMRRYLPRKWGTGFLYVVSALSLNFRRYIVGQTTEALILGGLCTVGMFILRLPYATMIGALIAVTAFIPVAGAYIGGCIGALMVFSQSPIQAVVFVVFLVLLQQVEGNLIYPRVVGSTMGLPPIWVLSAVTIGGGVMGILGMVLAVPLAATLYFLLRNDLNGLTSETSFAGVDSEQ